MAKRTKYGHCKATGKHKYYSERDAKDALKSTQRGRSQLKRGKRLERRFYFCDDCKGWHLTSMREPVVR
jgi:hypothetical protein